MPLTLNPIKPQQAVNGAYLKQGAVAEDLDRFRGNLTRFLQQSKQAEESGQHGESEEHFKGLLKDFLADTYYRKSVNGEKDYPINTLDRTDLAIYLGSGKNDRAGVLIENKRPSNKSEMLALDKPNAKALQELVLYFMRERKAGNTDLKHLLITNGLEFFLFNAQDFEKLFWDKKKFRKQFEDFEAGSAGGGKTDFFYNSIADPHIESLEVSLECAHFAVRDYEKLLTQEKPSRKLIALYKLLSPEHMLKLPFANDSNTLNKPFYNELLHIMGLEQREEKKGKKKVIGRLPSEKRNSGSLLELTIEQLEDIDLQGRGVAASTYGDNREERLFGIGLELVITWMNRVLFLKLLEAQLLQYHPQEQDKFHFLNKQFIPSYDHLNELFFKVLAKEVAERKLREPQKYAHIPYLNSSLFEPTELEKSLFQIPQLYNDGELPIESKTVLKDRNTTKRKTGSLNTLHYLFAFLDAYDFASEGGEEVKNERKDLINASVLGLIFEKINGYKEGSFYTPGFITMYMARETLRRAVVQKFRDQGELQGDSFDSLYNHIDRKYSSPEKVLEANALIDRLKVATPPWAAVTFWSAA